MFEFATLTEAADEQSLRGILSQSFRLDSKYWGAYVQRIGRENFRVLRKSGQVIGGLGLYRMGQWFGGRCLREAGVAAVGIAPEHRAAGAAAHLMTSTLNELYEQGVPLSALFASTQRPYRKVGYEQAGSRYQYKLPLAGIGIKEREATWHRIEDTEHNRYHELAQARARMTNGNLERNEALWERMVSFPYADKTVYRYVVGNSDQPEGYLLYYQDAAARGPYNLIVRDMVALTPRAARGLWSFFHDHRSLAESVSWFGPAVEPLLMLPQEIDVTVQGHLCWMVRIVDFCRALSERGYPAGVDGELHFEIDDDVVPANNGRFVLRVSNGVGEVEAGGRGDVRAPIRSISPLFTGFVSPAQLQTLGHIDASDDAIATAKAIFAGPEPWMPDMF